MRTKIVFFIFGSVVAFLALSLMPMAQADTDRILINYCYLTFGLIVAYVNEKFAIPWVLFFIPFLSFMFIGFR